MNKKVVFVGLSGGVDSAVSSALLKKEGYEVVGVFIKTWHPDFIECNEEEERHDAMRVAAFLDIPFLTFDFADVYKKEVADYMIREYKAGRTPNPDVMCNREVKFGAFLKKALKMGADFVATGHYARVGEEVIGGAGKSFSREYPATHRHHSKKFFLLRQSPDPSKDQSYFLWTLARDQLSKIIFPVGHLKKTEVRKLAKKFNLPVAEKKDSQGICFLGAVDLKEFLKHYIKSKKGDVVVLSEVEGESKYEVIGHHSGAVFSTLGERHGFTITKKGTNDGRYYVVAKDIKKNILVVSQNHHLAPGKSSWGTPPPQGGEGIQIQDTNWISGFPKESKNYKAQIRYHGEFLSCKIKITRKNLAAVIFEKPVMVAGGQSIVVYDGDICLGGGVVV
jgi:tRNA-specific 2-thiouridylase